MIEFWDAPTPSSGEGKSAPAIACSMIRGDQGLPRGTP